MLIDAFKLRFPELDTALVDAEVPGLVLVYKGYYNFEYGANDITDEAIFNLIAHLFLTETTPSVQALKEVASQGALGVSTSFTTSGVTGRLNEFFNWSKYGQRFLMLTQKRQGALLV
jgi:hypothetical protein